MADITFKFASDGSVTSKVTGVRGKGCHKVTEPYLKAIGGEVQDVTETSEACQGARTAILATQEKSQ